MKIVINNRKTKFLLLFLFFIVIEIGSLFFCSKNYHSMAWLSIMQLFLNIVFLINMYREKSIYTCIFIFFSWIFHCGQLIIKGFNTNVNLIFDVEKYATFSAIVKSFDFYYISQIILIIGIIFSSIFYIPKIRSKKNVENNYRRIAFFLFLIGIIPRLYIDISQLIGGITSGYSGVYSLIFPQILQTFAFLCDASIIFYLFIINDNKKRFLFLFITLYKMLMMMSGARQEKMVFLLMWFFIYYFLIKKVRVTTILKLVVVVYFGLSFIYSIGNLRVSDSIDLVEVMSNVFIPNDKMIGDLFAEFGSAFNTLAVTVYKTPQVIKYGHGVSYIAGIFSIIPKFVSYFPNLSNKVSYISLYKGTVYFGGSYLGEFYYNFGWYSLIIILFFGYFLGKVQSYIMVDKNKNEHDISKIMAVIIGIYLILFIRGYFTDFVQKIVWLYLFVFIFNKVKIKKVR